MENFDLSNGSCPNNVSHPVTCWDPLPNALTAGSWPWAITLMHTGHGCYHCPFISDVWALEAQWLLSAKRGSAILGPQSGRDGTPKGWVMGSKCKIKSLWSCRQTFLLIRLSRQLSNPPLGREGWRSRPRCFPLGHSHGCLVPKLINWLIG